jgi:uncharacterized protein (TIGR00290 family)
VDNLKSLELSVGCSWSGGKDSCFALMKAIEQRSTAKFLLNMMNENGEISRSHGLPYSILKSQADAMGLPLLAVPTSWENYESNFISALSQLKAAYQVDGMIFGDIDLHEHRVWEEKVCAHAGLKAILPIWQRPHRELLIEMLASGIVSVIVSCNSTMGEEYLGKQLDENLMPELEAMGIDVCGENGEFHTVVLNCPLFSQPVKLPPYHKVKHENYYFLQYLL